MEGGSKHEARRIKTTVSFEHRTNRSVGLKKGVLKEVYLVEINQSFVEQ